MPSANIVWNTAAWSRILKTSPEIHAALQEHVERAAAANSNELRSITKTDFKEEDAFKGKVVVGKHTQLGTVGIESLGAVWVSRAHGLPHW